MSTQKQIKLGAILSYASIAIKIATGLLYTPWMINSIGRDNFGLYTLAMSVISLFVFDFGLSSAVTRFISKFLANGEKQKANDFLGLVYKLYLGIDVLLFITFLVLFFFMPQIYRELTPDEIEKFKVVYGMAAIYSILSFPFIPVNGVLIAHEKFIQYRICDILHKLIIVGLVSACLLFGYGLYALVLVNTVAGLITIGMKLYCIRFYTSQRANIRYWDKEELKSIASYSGWVTVKALAQRCIMNVAPSILGILSGSEEIAILGIAITLEGYTFTFANAINGMFLPKVSRDLANSIDIVPLMTKVGRIQIVIIGLIVTGFALFGKEFIFMWVGDKFDSSYYCAVFMIIPSFFHLPQEIAHQTVYALNKVKLEAIVFFIMALINIIGAASLASDLGAFGVGISVFVAYLVRTVGMDYIYIKKMSINIYAFCKNTFIKSLIPISITVLVGVFINCVFPETGWLILVFKVAVYCVLYGIVMYWCFMNDFEKELLISPIRRFLKF